MAVGALPASLPRMRSFAAALLALAGAALPTSACVFESRAWQGDPVFSPDGTGIAFVECTGASIYGTGLDCHVEARIDGRDRRLAAERSFEEGTPLQWSPDGQWLIVPGSSIGLLSASGRRPVDVEAEIPALRRLSVMSQFLGWLPDGRVVGWQDNPNVCQLFATEIDGARYECLREEVPGWDAPWGPLLSPGGRHVAYKAAGLVRVLDIESSRVVLELEGGDIAFVRWSPDGRWLAVNQAEGLSLVALGGERVALAAQRSIFMTASAVAWAPSSQELAWVCREGAHPWICIADTGGGVRRFPAPSVIGPGIAWSPDGRTIATSCKGGSDKKRDICLFQWDGGRLTR